MTMTKEGQRVCGKTSLLGYEVLSWVRLQHLCAASPCASVNSRSSHGGYVDVSLPPLTGKSELRRKTFRWLLPPRASQDRALEGSLSLSLLFDRLVLVSFPPITAPNFSIKVANFGCRNTSFLLAKRNQLVHPPSPKRALCLGGCSVL